MASLFPHHSSTMQMAEQPLSSPPSTILPLSSGASATVPINLTCCEYMTTKPWLTLLGKKMP
jgi:hypothetical protein